MSDRRIRWRRQRAALAAGVARLLRHTLRPLGWRGCQHLAFALGHLAWWLDGRDRRRTLEHLAIAFPELEPLERRRLGRRCFAHLATVLCECLYLQGSDCAEVRRLTTVEGWEHVERLQRERSPILFVTGHCGNWELLAAAASCRGLQITAVARQHDEPRLDALLVGLRQRFGVRTLSRGGPGATRELLRALRGGALGMLIDQDTRVAGTWVPFFGRPAYTPLGAAQIGLRRDVTVMVAFGERLPGGRHLIRFRPPLLLRGEPVAATAALTLCIEEQVRRRPEQWVWMHRRWRRQPPAPEPAAGATR